MLMEFDTGSANLTIGLANGDDKLIVVSNREPYQHTYEYDQSGKRSIAVERPAGGLTAGLDPVMQQTNGTWIALGER